MLCKCGFEEHIVAHLVVCTNGWVAAVLILGLAPIIMSGHAPYCQCCCWEL